MSIRSWLAAEDRVLVDLAESSSHLAQEREELTCVWAGHHIGRFLQSKDKILSITGQPGSGKTVLASVLVDHLQHKIGGVMYQTLFIPISKSCSIQEPSTMNYGWF